MFKIPGWAVEKPVFLPGILNLYKITGKSQAVTYPQMLKKN